MSIAPANRASIADGPALKLVHWILTFDPIPFSNQPLALPIIGCAWVILGNAPTRIVVWARRTPENRQRTARTQPVRTQIPLLPQSHRLRIFAPWISVDHHWQDSGFFGFFLALAAGRFRALPNNVSQRSVLENLGCGIANIEEHLVKRTVLSIAINQAAKLFGVAERRQWAIDQADNLAKTNFPRRSPQLVPAFSAAHALHDAGVLPLTQDELENFFRTLFFIRTVANAHGTLIVVTRQHH